MPLSVSNSLHEAARANLADETAALLQAAGPGLVDNVNSKGETALHIAATHFSFEAASVLLQFKANVSIRDKESGWQPLHRSLYALSRAPTVQHKLASLRLIILLIKGGALLGDSISGLNSWREQVHNRRERFFEECDDDGLTPLDLLSATLSSGLAASRDAIACSSVVCFGKSDFQLGIPLPSSSQVLRPRKVDALLLLNPTLVAASRFHSAALSQCGTVYTWGHGKSGRLGHGDEATQPLPLAIKQLARTVIVAISLAENHSLALSREGRCYSWGSNRFGQLGMPDSTSGICVSPRQLILGPLKKAVISAIAAGAAHSVAADTTGNIYAWGCNEHGQLGLPGAASENSERGGNASFPVNCVMLPRTVLFNSSTPSSNSSAYTRSTGKVLQLSAGLASTLVLRTCPEAPLGPSPSGRGPTEVWQCGNGGNTFRPVNFRNRGGRQVHVVQLAAGREQHLALEKDGSVFFWGHGTCPGSCTSSEDSWSSPALLSPLLQENGAGKIVSISTSSSQSLAPTPCVAVSDVGDVYTWSLDSSGDPLVHRVERVVGVKRATSAVSGEGHVLVVVNATVPSRALPLPPPLPAAVGGPRSQARSDSDDSDSDSDDNDVTGRDDASSHGTPESSPLSLRADVTVERCDDCKPDVQCRDDEDGDGNSDGELDSPKSAIPRLVTFCEQRLALDVDLNNAFATLAWALRLSAHALQTYCLDFIIANLDALLVAAKPQDLEALLVEGLGVGAGAIAGVGSGGEYVAYSQNQNQGNKDRDRDKDKEKEQGQGGIPRRGSRSWSIGSTGSVGSNQDSERDRGSESPAPVPSLVLGRSQLQSVSDLSRALRGARKKLAQVIQLESLVSCGAGAGAGGISATGAGAGALSAEQQKKLQRRAALESEVSTLERQLSRAEAEESVKSASRVPSGKKAIPAPSSAQPSDAYVQAQNKCETKSPIPDSSNAQCQGQGQGQGQGQRRGKPVPVSFSSWQQLVSAAPDPAAPGSSPPPHANPCPPPKASPWKITPPTPVSAPAPAPAPVPVPSPGSISSSGIGMGSSSSAVKVSGSSSLSTALGGRPSLGARSASAPLSSQSQSMSPISGGNGGGFTLAAFMPRSLSQPHSTPPGSAVKGQGRSPAAPWAVPTHGLSTAGSSATVSGSPSATSWASSPTPTPSLSQIQAQEERDMSLSGTPPNLINGHTSRWFVSYRPRAESLELVMQQEQLEQQEATRLAEESEAAAAAVYAAVQRESRGNKGNGRNGRAVGHRKK